MWASHFPSDLKEAEAARDRLAFEELLLLQLAVLRERAGQEHEAQGASARRAG